MKKGVDYLSNKAFMAEIILSKEQDQLTLKAEKMLILLGNKVITKMRYYTPADREDCLQSGLVQMFTNWRHFDSEKSTNAFAYFTEVMKRGLAKGWNELHAHKGDPDHTSRTISLSSGGQDNEGIYNI